MWLWEAEHSWCRYVTRSEPLMDPKSSCSFILHFWLAVMASLITWSCHQEGWSETIRAMSQSKIIFLQVASDRCADDHSYANVLINGLLLLLLLLQWSRNAEEDLVSTLNARILLFIYRQQKAYWGGQVLGLLSLTTFLFSQPLLLFFASPCPNCKFPRAFVTDLSSSSVSSSTKYGT